jgi:UDP-N-acetylmuramate--alanine ligase
LKAFGNKNLRVGSGELFLVEACEYRRNFLSLHPDLLGITNIEMDHPDYFKDEADYQSAFDRLVEQSREVLFPEDFSEYEGELGVPGEHNQRNAGLAAQMARRLGVKEPDIARALSAYSGAWRRFEFKGISLYGARIYDDYAHHPSEIVATLQGARELYPEERIVVVFQPHQYSRTRALLQDFAEAFEEADEVIIPNIYPARDSEEDRKAVSPESLVEAISQVHDHVRNGSGLEKTQAYLEETLEEGDVLIVMGAGDVDQIIPKLLA